MPSPGSASAALTSALSRWHRTVLMVPEKEENLPVVLPIAVAHGEGYPDFAHVGQ